MAGKRKEEEVSVSFHSLIRQKKLKNGDFEKIEIGLSEFQDLVAAIKKRPKCDMSDEQVVSRLQLGLEVSLEKSEIIDDRTIFGLFRAPYTGHSFDNSVKGKIPADSVNLRPFHYVLYLASSGKIYLGSQYLGLYGAYRGISGTIRSMMAEPGTVHSKTFRLDAADFENIHAKEVKIKFARRPESIAAKNQFGSTGMIAFRKMEKGDGFEQQVARRLWPVIGRDSKTVKEEVAKLLNENKLFEASDEDIADCKVVANVNGREKTIYMLDDGNFATKFPITVPINLDGHPTYNETQSAMLEVLEDQIIAHSENV